MRCSQAVRDIRALGGGDLPSHDLVRHVETCSACAHVLAEHQRTLAAIKGMSWPAPGLELVARLQQPESLRRSTGFDGAETARTAHDVVAKSPHAPYREIARAPRRLRLTDAFAAGLVLAVAGWVYTQRQAAVPGASPLPIATVVGIASATPSSEARRVGDGGRLTEYRGVATQGIELVIDARWDESVDAACLRVWLELGDGTIEELECRDDIPRGAYPGGPSDTNYTVIHAFAAGTYFPQLRMVLQDGSELVQSAAQVMIAPAPPRPLAAEVVRLRPFPWALGLVVVGVLWSVTRRSRDRWLGLGGALCVAAYFGLAFVWPMAKPVASISHGIDGQVDRNPSMLAYLSGLRGQVGLDPLDPVAPLQDYRVETIQREGKYTYFATRFDYADGQSRTYLVPIERRSSLPMDGLGRLRTEHRELPGLPFADFDRDGIALDAPSRLDATSAADQPGVARSWLESGCWAGHGNLVPAPNGTAFLAARWTEERETSVWHVPTDGRPDRLVGGNVYDYQWSPDSRYLALVKPIVAAGFRVVIQSAGTGSELEIDAVVGSRARPGVTDHGVWFPQPDGVWRATWTDGDLHRVMTWPSDPAFTPSSPLQWSDDPTVQEGELVPEAALVRPSPDGTRMAYSCRGGLCFANLDGTGQTTVDVRAYEVAWSPDGQLLAAIESVPTESWGDGLPRDPRRLWLLDKDGERMTMAAVDLWGPVSPPTWTLDNQRLFLTACPYDGRRIITVDAATGEARDLSQPRWDAWAALMPSENALLLSNGRGGYWRAGIVER